MFALSLQIPRLELILSKQSEVHLKEFKDAGVRLWPEVNQIEVRRGSPKWDGC